MTMDRWSLPGPAGFLTMAMEALREGSNVIVGAPAPSAAALGAILEARVAVDWRVGGPVSAGGGPPIDEIYAAMCPENSRLSPRSVASLLAAFEHKVVMIVQGVDATRWPDWQRFLDEYANASRATPAMERTQLLVIAEGVPQSRLHVRAPALQTLIWDGVVGEADVFSYVIQAWRSNGKRIDRRAKLIARIITRLALWDFDLIDNLLRLDQRDLFDPVMAIRKAMGGNSSYTKLGLSWEEGGTAEFDGQVSEHAAAVLNGDDPKDELPMRLWAAQAAELLPALEMKRRRLAKRMKDARLSLPVIVNDEEIYDLTAVEIGTLLRLARKHRLPPDIVRTAEKYWVCRNKLAHLQPLGADEALDPEFLNS